MSGISTGTGIFSGIDTAGLIQQLLLAASRPKQLAEARLAQLQFQQAAYLDLNTGLSALKTASAAFRTEDTFQTKQATSTNGDVLSAVAGTSAQKGTYQFLVDRLVTSQQVLSRGFVDQDASAAGFSQLAFEPSQARLSRDVALADLNDGNGVDRGVILVNGVEVDLSRVATVNDVLDAVDASGSGATASIEGDHIVLDGVMTLADKPGYSGSLESLGFNAVTKTIASAEIGTAIYRLNDNTALASLRDGAGVDVGDIVGVGIAKYDFIINVNGTDAFVNLGDIYETDTESGDLEVIEGAVSTAGGVVDRINDALTTAGISGVTASIDLATNGGGFTLTGAGGDTITITENALTNATTAANIGLSGSSTGGVLAGARVMAGLNTTLVSSLNGGLGIEGDQQIVFQARDTTSFLVTLTSAENTLTDVVDAINSAAGNDGRIVASVNQSGTGLQIEDTTGGSANLIVDGNGADNTAESLGISTGPAGIASDSVLGTNLQLRYIDRATRLDGLNGGAGIGSGSFTITDSIGNVKTVTLTDDDRSIGDVLDKINDSTVSGFAVVARINDNGDGIILEEEAGTNGASAISVADDGGSVALRLNLRGTADGVGAENTIDGSFERVLDFDGDATLDDIVDAINSAGLGVSAGVINDGTGTSPYRLNLVSDDSGSAGRFLVDTFGVDLGMETLEAGQDARVFFGSSDPAKGVLLTSSSDTLDSVISGVTIDLKSVSSEPVSLSVTTDTTGIEAGVQSFVESFNNVIDRIDRQTRFVPDTGERGPLLGDGTALGLRAALYRAIQSENEGFSATYNRLVSVGITIGDGAKLEFDRDRFRQALEDDPDAVEALFTTRTIDRDGNETEISDGITTRNPSGADTFTALGVINQIEEFANGYVTTLGGKLSIRNESLDAQIKNQVGRIEAFNARLEVRRGILERQFLAMETAIASLQTQSGALASIGAIR